MRRRYVYRVMVKDVSGWRVVRHYQSLSAAQARAVQWSTARGGYPETVVRVDRSAPVEFERDGIVRCVEVYEGGVRRA